MAVMRIVAVVAHDEERVCKHCNRLEVWDIRELRENRTLRLEDGVGTDPKTMEIQAMSAFLKFDFGNMQHQGRRDYQEDSFGFSDISDPELVAKRGILAIVEATSSLLTV